MEQLGLLEQRDRPRMVVVQAAGCAPMVRAFEQGARKAARWEEPRTYACGLQVPAAIGDELILSAVRESGGTAVAVSDREMASAQLAMARGEGIFPAPEGGATYAALQKLCARQWIDPAESVLLFNTGCGLKYPRIPGLRIP
jgi:threonine synthase